MFPEFRKCVKELEWEPYLGYNRDAGILHWHGPQLWISGCDDEAVDKRRERANESAMLAWITMVPIPWSIENGVATIATKEEVLEGSYLLLTCTKTMLPRYVQWSFWMKLRGSTTTSKSQGEKKMMNRTKYFSDIYP